LTHACKLAIVVEEAKALLDDSKHILDILADTPKCLGKLVQVMVKLILVRTNEDGPVKISSITKEEQPLKRLGCSMHLHTWYATQHLRASGNHHGGQLGQHQSSHSACHFGYQDDQLRQTE
jgi:hypothetical protein